MPTGCTITTRSGPRQNEWIKPRVQVYYTRGALGMSTIAWMTNKACPVIPLILALVLPCWGLSLSTSLPVCLLDSLSASFPAAKLPSQCPSASLFALKLDFLFEFTTGQGESYIWVFPFPLIQTWRKTLYESGTKPADPILPAFM